MARKQTIEAGMSELEALTERLAEGDMTLDETIKTDEKGVALAAQLKQQLADCSRRIEQIDPETAEITPLQPLGRYLDTSACCGWEVSVGYLTDSNFGEASI